MGRLVEYSHLPEFEATWNFMFSMERGPHGVDLYYLDCVGLTIDEEGGGCDYDPLPSQDDISVTKGVYNSIKYLDIIMPKLVEQFAPNCKTIVNIEHLIDWRV